MTPVLPLAEAAVRLRARSAPRRCPVCSVPTPDGEACSPCLTDLRRQVYALQEARAKVGKIIRERPATQEAT